MKRRRNKRFPRQPARKTSGRAPSFATGESEGCRRVLAEWRQKRDDAVLAQWGELARTEPRNLRTLGLAARSFGERFRFEQTRKLVRRMERLDPSSSLVHQMIGDVWRAIGQAEDAMKSYEKALKGTTPRDSLSLALAAQYERSRRDDEALALLRRVDQGPPGDLIRARILKRRGEAEKAIDLLRKLASSLAREAEIRLEALGDLALLHDRQGEYDEAFDLATEAKQVHLGRSSAEQATSHHVIGRFAQMVDQLQPEDFERWSREFEPPSNDLRPVLLTGFPRSGTTLLEQVLDAHPQVVSLEERDLIAREILPAMHGRLSAAEPLLRILNEQSGESIAQHRRFVWQAFEAMGGRSLDGLVHVDKNPAYNLVIPFYLRLFPETRFLVALRDPRDVLLSCYLRYLPLNPISVTFLTLQSTAHRYALDMTAWLKFSTMIPGSWTEVRYEDIVRDLEPESRRVCETLDVPWDPGVMDYRRHLKGKRVNSPTYDDVTRPIYSSAIGRWKNYRKHLEPHFEPLAPFLEAFEYT